MVRIKCLFLILLISSLFKGSLSILCYNCNLREHLKKLSKYEEIEVWNLLRRNYHHHHILKDPSVVIQCPKIDADVRWASLEYYYELSECQAGISKCTVGRWTISSRQGLLSRGTFMGCASPELVRRLNWIGEGGCENKVSYSRGEVLNMSLTYCNSVQEFCDYDFCIPKDQAYISSKLPSPQTSGGGGLHSNYFYVIVFLGPILGLAVLCIILKVVISKCCCKSKKAKLDSVDGEPKPRRPRAQGIALAELAEGGIREVVVEPDAGLKRTQVPGSSNRVKKREDEVQGKEKKEKKEKVLCHA